MADIGWITGHSYVVYGPLSNGGTTVLFESTPVYPDPGENMSLVEGDVSAEYTIFGDPFTLMLHTYHVTI